MTGRDTDEQRLINFYASTSWLDAEEAAVVCSGHSDPSSCSLASSNQVTDLVPQVIQAVMGGRPGGDLAV